MKLRGHPGRSTDVWAAKIPAQSCHASRSSSEWSSTPSPPPNLPAVRYVPTLIFCLAAAKTLCQTVPEGTTGQFMLSEDIGLAMNKAQVLAAAQDAWSSSFGQEPGNQVTLLDADNGLLEGASRMNYRSKMLLGREETMGTIAYQVTIQATNGQCHVRVHNLRHTGNRAAKGGGINAGAIMDGDAPVEHYEGVGLNVSRRMHADIREAATARLQENLRRFVARLRLLGGQ